MSILNSRLLTHTAKYHGLKIILCQTFAPFIRQSTGCTKN
jgi:hypothetical protein